MRRRRLKLVNYIGIYNGLRLNEIEIDFTKGKHNLVIIKGVNGCGKSVILKAATMIPDTNSSFIPGVCAIKEIDYDGDNGEIYEIKCIHNVNSKGEREPAKVTIDKIIDGERVQLNPNGNVGSYKECIFNEFGLDPNYLALSSLSLTKRGLADMQPAERKKYFSSIIQELVEYNDMYKVLSKRSSVFKSMVNSMVSKINSIGNAELLKNTLSSIENRLNSLLKQKDDLVQDIANIKSTIAVHDATGNIQITYNALCKELLDTTERNKFYTNKIQEFNSKYNNSISISELHSLIKSKISSLNTDIQILDTKIISLLNEREKESKNLQEETIKLNSMQCEYNFKEIEFKVDELTKQKLLYEDILNKMDINMNGLYSVDEYNTILNIIMDIVGSMGVVKSNYSYDIIQNYDDHNIDRNIDQKISQYQNMLLDINSDINKYSTMSEIASNISNRPSGCKIDTCPFIKDAIESFNQKPDIKLVELNNHKIILEEEIQNLIKQKESQNKLILYSNELNLIFRSISNYKGLLNKAGIYLTNDDIVRYMKSGYTMTDELELINLKIEYCNVYNTLNAICSDLSEYKNIYNQLESKKDMIDYISEAIDKLYSNLNTISVDLDKYNGEIASKKSELVDNTNLLLEIEEILNILNQKQAIDNTINDINTKISSIQSSMNIINLNLSKLNELNSTLQEINKQISPMIEDRDSIKHSLKLLEEYSYDLEQYQNKYAKIETIKKYSSPTTGIQLVFMELYMNTTMVLANELLAMMFNGEYVLSPFVINEKEFRIPCLGEGFINDDISSMSGAQICMISMILSFSILHQSSSRYNIMDLDEIDAMLDTTNRNNFIPLIYKLMDILKIDQCLMVSHNTENTLSNVDVIVLKTDDSITEGNIIYEY